MEERFALLIDADNVSAKYIKPILDELSKYGNVTYKRISETGPVRTARGGRKNFCRTLSLRSSSLVILTEKMQLTRQ